MADIPLQLARLDRNYHTALRGYDQISLLDLVHALRVVVEAKNALAAAKPAFKEVTRFQNGRPTERINKVTSNHEYVMSFMPGGVLTRAKLGTSSLLAGFPIEPRHQRKVLVAVSAKAVPNGVVMDQYCVIFRGDEESKAIAPVLGSKEGMQVTKVSFDGYLQGEAVRVGFLDHKQTYQTAAIRREQFVKVVANTLGGSHAHQDASKGHTNRFAEPVHHLMKFMWGGLPLPYFIVMKVTQDILEAASAH